MIGLSLGSDPLGSGMIVRLIHRDRPPFTDDKLCRAWSFPPDERAVMERAGFRLAEAKSKAEVQVTHAEAQGAASRRVPGVRRRRTCRRGWDRPSHGRRSGRVEGDSVADCALRGHA